MTDKRNDASNAGLPVMYIRDDLPRVHAVLRRGLASDEHADFVRQFAGRRGG